MKTAAIAGALMLALAAAPSCRKFDPRELVKKPVAEDTTATRKASFIEIGKRKLLEPEGTANPAGDTASKLPLKEKPLVSAE